MGTMTKRLSHRDLLLPKEHGGWSLAFEPVALGLLVAPSAAGAVLALAAVAGFFTRRPLKLALTLPTTDPRRGPAQRWAAFFALLMLTLLAGAAGLGSTRALWPLLLAAPLGGLFLWFDLRHAMREAEAELAGSAAFALLPAACATLAGWPAPTALALATLALARNVPTVLTVRTCLRLGKAQETNALPPLAAGGAAFTVAALLAWQGLVPAVAVAVHAVFWIRTGWLVSALRPAWPARQVGVMEAVLGGLQLGVLAAAYHWR
jgi:hypothetical protein